MPLPWLAQLLLGALVNVAAALIMAGRKQTTPEELKDFEGPTANPGQPVIRLHGSATIKRINLILIDDVETEVTTQKTGKK